LRREAARAEGGGEDEWNWGIWYEIHEETIKVFKIIKKIYKNGTSWNWKASVRQRIPSFRQRASVYRIEKKIFTNSTSNRELISKIHKEHTKKTRYQKPK